MFSQFELPPLSLLIIHSLDQAADYHTLSLYTGASSMTLNLGGCGVRKFMSRYLYVI